MSTAKARRRAAKGPPAIDIHAHYFPEVYLRAVESEGDLGDDRPVRTVTGLKGLTRADQARILGGNAARLLSIN